MKNKLIPLTMVLACFALANPSFAKEELSIVQTVSKNRKSFVMSKGLKDGVLKGNEMIFSNDNISIVCRAVEVNRDFSLWKPVDPTVVIPFNKDEVVSSNGNVYGNVVVQLAGNETITPQVNYNEVYKEFRTKNNYALKASLNRGLSQSSSSVANDKNSSRSGFTIGAEYNYRFKPEFEVSGGIRYDSEIYRIESPELDIPTKRIIGLVAATYHFVNLSDNKNNFYLSVAAGIGQAQTTVNEETSKGAMTLLPEVRVGFLMPFSTDLAMVFEGSVETLNAKESFSDGTEQTTNILNLKATVGVRF